MFSLRLAIVLIGGAELFIGNNLIVMAWASGKISTTEVLRNWLIVYCGNLVGSLGLVILVLLSHHPDFNGGRIGLSILTTAVAKISPDMVTLFFKGILCNVLVCLGVWLAYAGRSVTDKIVGLILPISAFVAAGFEHCIANMYFLPLAWLLTETGRQPWVVYGLLETANANSPSVSAWTIGVSLGVFVALYLALLVLDIWLMRRFAGRDPSEPGGEGEGLLMPAACS